MLAVNKTNLYFVLKNVYKTQSIFSLLRLSCSSLAKAYSCRWC